MIDRRAFIKGASSTAAVLGAQRGISQTKANQERPPNIVFILPDEWRGQALGCMGNPDVQTPNLDRLASEGLLLRNTFSNSPVCCPARACIQTGTYTSRNGMVANDLRLREDERGIADSFAQAGYRTAYVGKWHLDGGPREPGFVPPGRRHGYQHWAANECNHNYFYNWYFRDENVPIVTHEYTPKVFTDLAVEFLYELQQDKPFFLMLSFAAPHDPYLAPEKYMDLYDAEKLTMEPNWVEGTPGGGRKDLAGYYAGITAIDDQMGLLFQTLSELGLEENTIVLFSSDHGNMLGSQGQFLKRKPWEESIRVPGIIRYPKKIAPNRKSDALFSHVDIAPTLLSLCGIPIPAAMQGSDLSGLILGSEEYGPEAAYFQIFGPYEASHLPAGWRGIRTEHYMYARFATGPWLLYDLKKDPYEMMNLIHDASAQDVMHELDNKLTAWMAKVGDSWKLDWTEPVEDGPKLFQYDTFYTVDEYLAWAKAHPNLAQNG
jgi:arylsulfatase A-like enzyme